MTPMTGSLDTPLWGLSMALNPHPSLWAYRGLCGVFAVQKAYRRVSRMTVRDGMTPGMTARITRVFCSSRPPRRSASSPVRTCR
jgi:hypothetical protein